MKYCVTIMHKQGGPSGNNAPLRADHVMDMNEHVSDPNRFDHETLKHEAIEAARPFTTPAGEEIKDSNILHIQARRYIPPFE